MVVNVYRVLFPSSKSKLYGDRIVATSRKTEDDADGKSVETWSVVWSSSISSTTSFESMNDWVVFSSSNSFSSFSCFTCSGSRVFSPFPFPRIFSSNDFRVSGRLKRSNDLKTTFGLATGFWKSEEPESEGCSRFSFGAFRRLERPGSLMEDSFTDSSGGGVVVWAFCEAASRNLIIILIST